MTILLAILLIIFVVDVISLGMRAHQLALDGYTLTSRSSPSVASNPTIPPASLPANNASAWTPHSAMPV